MDIKTGILVLWAILALLVGGLLGGFVFPSEKVVVSEILVTPNCTATPDFVLTEAEYNAKLEDARALELAVESIESEDFNEALFDALEDFGVDVEEVEDITKFKYEVEVNGNEVEIENLKVYYFVDGDKDEAEKALFDDFTIKVKDLDSDDLSEAEVNEHYLRNLSVDKVYN